MSVTPFSADNSLQLQDLWTTYLPYYVSWWKNKRACNHCFLFSELEFDYPGPEPKFENLVRGRVWGWLQYPNALPDEFTSIGYQFYITPIGIKLWGTRRNEQGLYIQTESGEEIELEREALISPKFWAEKVCPICKEPGWWEENHTSGSDSSSDSSSESEFSLNLE